MDGELIYNGVVFNEMKGVFSSAKQLLDRNIQQSLFPDTAYGVESGGDPASIPDLTYEDYLAFHKNIIIHRIVICICMEIWIWKKS